MAENRFQITLTAVDKASKVLNDVNKNVNKLFRPYDNARKSIKSFSDALGRNDLVKRPLWALEKVGKGVTMFGNAFGMAESSVLGGSTRIASALGMIGGPIGGFLAGTAALVGGAGAVTVAMANMGFNVDRTAKNLNIGTRELQEYRGAAKMAGIDTRAVDQGFQSLGETLQDADFGRNPMVSEALRRMGVSIGRTKDGAVDTVKAFRDISDVVSHMQDQNMARKLTDMLGVTELLPLLRQGSGKMDEYIATARRVGAVMDEETIQKNKQQAEAWNQTKTALEGAGISLGNMVAKYLSLREAADMATSAAQKITNMGGGGKHWWDDISLPWYMNPKGILQFMPSGAPGIPEGPRSSSGKIGGSSSAMGLRNNNPGNLRSWPGAGSAGGFASFNSPQAGLTAMGKNLLAYQDKHGLNTISGIVNRWAPPSENNTGAYVASVSKATGFGANQPLDLHNPQTLAPLISAITKQENGQNPYSPEMISQAVASAIRDTQAGGDRPITVVVQNVPHGMTVKPVRGLGQASVGLTMAPGGMS